METVCFSETLASTDQSTWCQNPEEHHHYRHHCENLKSHNYNVSNFVSIAITQENYNKTPMLHRV
jgi:hypothetical protein